MGCFIEVNMDTVANVIERIFEEMDDLNVKIKKLGTFIYTNDDFSKLSRRQKSLLIKQLEVMQEYSRILSCRVEDLYDA